ncbi:MAG: glycosyltransferase family A protein, partial [Pricia sp.]
MNTDSGKTKSDYFTTRDGNLLDEFADGLNRTLPVNKWKPEVVITIPAHDEEKLIARCIEALAHQQTCQGKNLDRRTYEILIFCHNCTDDTRNRSLMTLAKFPDLNLTVLESNRPEINNVGAVRRVLMRIASKRVAGPHGYIAMTDADSVADSHWVANIMKFIGSCYGL